MELVGQGGQRESEPRSSPLMAADGSDTGRSDTGRSDSDHSSTDRPEVAFRSKISTRVYLWRLALFLTLGLLGCGVDLLTKHLAFSRLGLPSERVYWIWEGFLGFQTAINHGALFGLGQGMVPMLAIVSFAALLGLAIWVVRGGALDSLGLTISLGMILGGILGNLYDRLGLWGHAGVRDWILCCYKEWVWPNFNIADSLLVCGAILMVWLSWQDERSNKA